ncbi:hypothetical protein [Hansschlegelia zhihuaiae]|uniref:Integrase n=1 Tax=Hansschlegelia zhihuaiae TaxID=405005 RepID=A0A4Q0MFK4_9HYPH|nr:hypothetical protein [Hansschlegelia zhihuaiae]RXF72075.1 hypothetical protein EK403_14790 [Hansschlegelia zhihuaiae]
MPSEQDRNDQDRRPPPVSAPGLTSRANADGSRRYYWRAPKRDVAAGYLPALCPVAGDDATDVGRAAIAHEAQRLQTDALRWRDAQQNPAPFDGTLAGLVRRYQTDEESPYRAVKWNTRRLYDHDCGRLVKGMGARRLESVKRADIHRWHAAALAPKPLPPKPGEEPDIPPVFGPPRVRSAHGLMKMLRVVVAYGVSIDAPHCERLDLVLSKMRFQTPRVRKDRPTYDQAVAIIAKAHELGAHSIAFAQALQFDGMFRQSNVVGLWRPLDRSEEPNGRLLQNGRVWEDGLCWRHIGEDGVIRFETTKRGRGVEIDLGLCPLAQAEIDRVPAERRMGPLIVDERTGRPYVEHAFGKLWRKVADAAGVPRAVWNRDSRSGGITEGRLAGADFADLAKQAAHSDPNFTARVYDRDQLEAARKVARLRAAMREANAKNGS